MWYFLIILTNVLLYNLMKEKLTELNRQGSLYMVWNEKRFFFTSAQGRNIILLQVCFYFVMRETSCCIIKIFSSRDLDDLLYMHDIILNNCLVRYYHNDFS